MIGDKYTKFSATGGGASVGLKLMKTGQTTSYRTGDDGDLEAGRATSFTVLASNNPFGNTNRFTDELGGTTYTNNIAIDWSTYDGSTVLGYKRTLRAVGINWNDAIDEALSLSIGGFISGWRMCNVKEIINLYDYSKLDGSIMNYVPFSLITGGLLLWTSNTKASITNTSYVMSNTNLMTQQTKTSSASTTYMACRTFTVTGTILT
jgi:hypothetical protein